MVFGFPVRLLLILACTAMIAEGVDAQNPASTNTESVRHLADSIAGTGPTIERTRRLVHWINDSFEWSATDYQRRTPAEVIQRRGGNCAELASVLAVFLDSLGVRKRWVREINVQPAPTPRRQETAAALVATRGNALSVFGLQHNDHVWLEVWDDATRSWFPADPAYGVAGVHEWSVSRLAMEQRPKPRVSAVEPIAAEMLVPFVVVAGEKRGGPYDTDRTADYLVDGFNALYGGALSALPAWSEWRRAVSALAPHARAAFDGRENLHVRAAEIAALKATFDQLSREAAALRLTWSRERPASN